MSELQRLLAQEIRAEMVRQGITARDMQQRTGIKHASWGNYFVSVKRDVPLGVVDDVCRELGMPSAEMIARAEARRPTESAAEQALAEMSPEAAAEVRRAAARIRPATSADGTGHNAGAV